MAASISMLVLMLLLWIHAAHLTCGNMAMIEKLLHSVKQDRKKPNIKEDMRETAVVKVGPFERKSLCGGLLTAPAGLITSPNFPSNYDINANYEWTIKAPEGSTVAVAFIDFDLDTHYTCAYDYVQIFNGTNISTTDNEKACGTRAPRPFKSSGASVRIVFHSDHSVTKTGFRMIYMVDSKVKESCPENEKANSTFCTDGWQKHGSSCYLFELGPNTFQEAENNCQKQGAHLVHINDAEENALITGRLKTITQTQSVRVHWFRLVWMGLSAKNTEGVWKWVDTNTAPEFTDWLPGKPEVFGIYDDYCAVFWFDDVYMGEGNGKWRNERCPSIHPSVCERESM